MDNKVLPGADQFDWTRTDKVSSIANTGPMRAQSGLWYIYAQADGRNVDDTAILETPVFNFITSVCLTFYYNMNGVNVGALFVYTRSQGPNRAAWETFGNQGDIWKVKSLTLVLASMDTIIFKARTGNGIFGDIAIDNLNIRAGSCEKCDFIKFQEPFNLKVLYFSSITISLRVRIFWIMWYIATEERRL